MIKLSGVAQSEYFHEILSKNLNNESVNILFISIYSFYK